jgi:hypothetical protein
MMRASGGRHVRSRKLATEQPSAPASLKRFMSSPDDGLRGHSVEATGLALPFRALDRLAQDEEPGRAGGGEERGGRGLKAGRALMPLGNPAPANILNRQVGG